MALLVLFSTMSFRVDMHYCGDHLVDFSFFDGAATCGMDASMSEQSDGHGMVAMDMDCCSDVQIVLDGQDHLKISFDQFSFEQQVFITSFAYTYFYRFEDVDKNIVPFKAYSPPPLIRDVQVLDQTFLI